MNSDHPHNKNMRVSVNANSLSFLGWSTEEIYVFKKAEKIVTAVYLVSGLLKDNDPLRISLRDKGMNLLEFSLGLGFESGSNKDEVLRDMIKISVSLLSLFDICHSTRLISTMNNNVLRTELQTFIDFIERNVYGAHPASHYVLSDTFFDPVDVSSEANTKHLVKKQPSAGKSSVPSTVKEDGTVKKTSRRDAILGLVKDRSDLTIKDFAAVITDCSEKTIQRELLQLVDEGVLHKSGERRWSRYSLKTSDAAPPPNPESSQTEP